MAVVQYNGHYTVIYPDHIDLTTGKTLVAVPGQSYTTIVASGRHPLLSSTPGDGRWGANYGVGIETPKELEAGSESGKKKYAAETADKPAGEGVKTSG